MDTGLPGQVQQQLRKRTPDKSGMSSTSTREQNTNYSLAKDLNDQEDEDLDLLTKKQRQGSPDRNSSVAASLDNGTSTGSSETGDVDSSCAHIGKAVNLSLVRKIIINTNGGKIFTDCVDCKRNLQTATNNGDVDNSVMSDLYEFDDSVWICLRCGHAGCGRMRAAHAVAHNSAPHSDSHDLVVQTGSWRVWCYKCDDDVNVTKRTAKLRDTIEYLKKLAGHQCKTRNKVSSTIIPLPPCQPMDIPPIQDVGASLPRTRGLRNLGNTCFFNSVMQCLGQTPYLAELLRETEKSGRQFRLIGGQVPLSSVEQAEEDKERMAAGAVKRDGAAARAARIVVPSLQGELKDWGPLAQILTITLEELQSGRAEVYNPRGLLGQLATKHPQFGRGDQQDAHELLRHLLEAVREEDLRRYQEVILNKHKLSRRTDPASIDADKRKILKFYGSQAEVLLPTLQVFKGILVSTLQCKDCGHTSNREEFFLDLSLPINEQQPKHRRKADELLEESRPSKHQLKKDKRITAKKNKKSKNHRNSTNQIVDVTTEADNNLKNKSDTDSDADIEDNIDDNTNPGQKYSGVTTKRNNNNNKNKSSESGYNSDNRTRQSPESGLTLTCAEQEVSSGGNSGAHLSGVRTPDHDERNGQLERPASRLEHVARRNDLKDNLAKLTLDYPQAHEQERMDLDSPQEDSPQSFNSHPSVSSPPSSSNNSPSSSAKCDHNDDELASSSNEADVQSSDHDSPGRGSYTHTPLGGRYSAADGECSIQSCLSQFTSSELMMGANAVLCTVCTRRAAGKKQYRTALKQLLIYQPPPVLILHLKRFQVHHYHSTKLSKQVSFPFILNLAPFCSRRIRRNELPSNSSAATSNITGNTVQYALYGVVEHSGSIHGGHYVAYVKVRPTLEENSPRWKHLRNNELQNEELNSAACSFAEDPSPSLGSWYYVSDSHVQEVSEDRVLNSQAYVLFYERIV